MRETALAVRDSGLPLRFLDIAAGHGRYMIEVLRALKGTGPFDALLRDYDPANVEQGRKLITGKWL